MSTGGEISRSIGLEDTVAEMQFEIDIGFLCDTALVVQVRWQFETTFTRAWVNTGLRNKRVTTNINQRIITRHGKPHGKVTRHRRVAKEKPLINRTLFT